MHCKGPDSKYELRDRYERIYTRLNSGHRDWQRAPEGGGWEKGSVKNTSFNSMVSHALGYVKGWASKLIISEW